MQEIWKDIKGYEGLYKVSSLGNIKSCYNNKYGKGKFKTLKPQLVKNGYLYIGLTNNKIKKQYRLNRLVAICFIKNPENKPQVNHINGIKPDNRVENLEWCTRSENEKHKYEVLGIKGTWSNKRGKDNPSSKKVNQYTKEGNFIKTWDSLMDIERELGIYNSNISKVINGKAKTTGGYKWKYFNN